jgi:polar amino acid transport system substrate-binding protein
MCLSLRAAGAAMLAVLATFAVQAQTTLDVGLRHNPPFVIATEGQAPSGLAVALWNDIAADLGHEVNWVPKTTVGQMLSALEAGQLDVAVGAVTVTADRESRVDFSHPYFRGGIGIATRAESGLVATLVSLVSWPFIQSLAVLGLVLLLFGVLVWLVERRRNPEQFGGSPAQGVGAGFWWSAVTMTTVGYGDKAPITLGGRTVALVWMFLSVITISSFTAAIASAVTVGRLNSQVQGVADLRQANVLTINDSSSEAALRELGIGFRSVDDPDAALDALISGQTDAVVYDAPVLKARLLDKAADDVVVLPALVREEDYAFGLQPGSALRKAVNEALLERTRSPDWAQARQQYLGAR